MRYGIYIGIDCGVKTGIAYWKPETKFFFVSTVEIHRAMYAVKNYHDANPGRIFVRIEDARLRKWIPRQKNEKSERGRREGAGSVKRDAKIWEDFLTDHKIPFEMVAPKNNKTKVSAEYFKKLTGYQERCSEHARDAGMLVFGM